ncbi:hypothetical protein [Pseudomonas salomonii]|uniref:Uncharacterized protein n=1 Tax=Pseudomonas salomonii TaxID=191391 RepID=A0A1H3KEZ2_9PSED|nr:hypothetical protein [Pseudomonas salomonii]SDY50134.1 hypothetical protein SAMN05216247_10461 [Pseudomonas salomonii]
MTTSVELAQYHLNDAGQLMEATHESIFIVEVGSYVIDMLEPYLIEREALESDGQDTFSIDVVSETEASLRHSINRVIGEIIEEYQSKDREQKDELENVMCELVLLKKLIAKSMAEPEDGAVLVISLI